jgi:sialidase-1
MIETVARLFGLFLISQSAALAHPADQSLEPVKADVFVSGTHGYHTYRIPALAVTTNGTLLVFCEGRKSAAADSGAIDLLTKRSTDGGKSWSARHSVWSDGENTCGNPAPVVDQNTGVIWLLMTWNLGSDTEKNITHGVSKATRRVFVTHSADDGNTWTKPIDITASAKRSDWQWYATGPVNGIQLTRAPRRGRLVIPANHSELLAGGVITRSHVIFSDDHGATWQIGGSEEEKTNESTIVELTDGRLLQNMRSYHQKNRRAIATSSDGGMAWSPVKWDDALIEPICQASLLRATWSSETRPGAILFCNPASLKRENLTIRISHDEGTSWTTGKVIHPGPSAYSCLAVLPDQTICCLYECGDHKPYEKISLATFPLSWLEGTHQLTRQPRGVKPSPSSRTSKSLW